MTDPTELTAASCLVVGVFAALAAALAGVGWRPRVGHRVLLLVGFGLLGVVVFDDAATERLLQAPAEAATPPRSKFCPPPAPEEEAGAAADEPQPPPPMVEQPGCALVKRAYELGYAKDLGDCAPKAAEVADKPAEDARVDVCTRRLHDEPYLHHAWRKIAGAAGSLTSSNPIAATSRRLDAMRTRFDFFDTLAARQLHAIGGSPHASHHLWVSLPDPRGGTWLGDLLAPPRCEDRYADLPLWPAWREGAWSPSALVEHVLGQLLFATRFGSPPATCRDVTVHWGAPVDACERLAADPAGFLDGAGALESVRAVIDRRRRQHELRALAVALGESPSFGEPPEVEQLVSLQCLAVDPAGTGVAAGFTVTLDGQPLGVRQVRVPAIDAAGAGPLDVYAALAALLAGPHGGAAAVDGTRIGARPPEPSEVAGDDYLLSRLERLHDADPFLGVRWPLAAPPRQGLVDVYPFHRHLFGFVDAFRRRYRAQRGRL